MINLPIKTAGEIKEIVNDFLYSYSNNCSKMIDDELAETINLISDKFSSCYYDLNIIVNHIDQKEVSEAEFDAKILLWQGLNSLISSLQLIRQGFFTEPNILNRHAIENLALAISIKNNFEHHDKFRNGKLTGEKCITFAKKIIPEIGTIYGILSNFSHPGNDNLGNYYHEDENIKTYIIGGGITKKYLYRTKFNLAPLGIITQVYLAGIEYIYQRHLLVLNLWTKQGKYLKWSPNNLEKKYSEILQKILTEGLSEMTNKNNSI